MLVGLEVGRQVAAAALLAMSSVAPHPGVTPSSDSSPAACAAPTAAAGSTSTTAPAVAAGTGNAAGTATARYPAQLLPLDDWKLTLPTGAEGGPQEIEQPELSTYSSEHFQLNRTADGVVFRAGVGGVTTENSSYPRSELREMNGGERAAWSSTSGTHTMDVCQAITETPVAKPHVVSAQIHDGDDDVLQIRLEGSRLMVQYDDGAKAVDLDPAYRLGTPFHVRIVAAAGGVRVLHNGQEKANLPLTGTGWYWKVGAYVQSNTSRGDGPDAAGEVVVHSLRLDHGGASTGPEPAA